MSRVPPCMAPDGLGYGDVNGDGYVTSADSDLIAMYVVGMVTLTDAQKVRANVSGSGAVDIADATTIGMYISGKINSFPVCPDYDPCEGIVCNPECFGVDRHDTVCSEGVCIKGVLIESNVTECGYVPPEPDPDPYDKTNVVFMLIIAIIIFIMITR